LAPGDIDVKHGFYRTNPRVPKELLSSLLIKLPLKVNLSDRPTAGFWLGLKQQLYNIRHFLEITAVFVSLSPKA